MYVSDYLPEEVAHVLRDELGFSSRLAALLQRRIVGRCRFVTIRSSAQVPQDSKDSPVLQAALSCGADYLVTNDRHLLALDPFEGLRIISITE